ncbi:MAG TPA: hypothetical protein DCP91_03340 [Eggerthellaceae bacterium]|nr:hypothetical protein [Eggerthellaceae bacterium]
MVQRVYVRGTDAGRAQRASGAGPGKGEGVMSGRELRRSAANDIDNGNRGLPARSGAGASARAVQAVTLRVARASRAALALAAALVLACALAFAGCGSDALTTTKQSDSASASASASSSAAASGESANGVRSVAPDAVPGENEVLVVFDTSKAHAYNDKFPESVGAFMVPFEEGLTAFDTLQATGVDYALRGKDYVKSIAGIEEKVCGPNSGWLYLVDGAQSSKNAMDYKLSGGQTLVWGYTVEEGDFGQTMPKDAA